jgi:hypothetical protein
MFPEKMKAIVLVPIRSESGSRSVENRKPRFPEAFKADAKHSASVTTVLTTAVDA